MVSLNETFGNFRGIDMATLIDHLKKLYKNYTAPTTEDDKIGRKEKQLTEASETPIPKEDIFTKRLTVEKCVNAAEQCPLFMKGARKKSKDSIRAWHRIEHMDKTKKPFSIDLTYIRNFVKRNNLPRLWERMRVASFIAGDGYLLITFENDEDTKIEDPPSKDAVPYRVELLNSQYIKELGYYSKYYKDKFIRHYHYIDISNNEDKWIHPDRIIQLSCDELFGPFGNSKVNLLRNVLKSNVNIDIATGEILAYFAHGLLDIKQEDMDDNDIKKWKDIVKAHPSAYIHKEGEIKAIELKAIDPKSFYDYIILCIAAAFYMPTHILTGIQVGKVTGAEIGTGDYVKDLKDDQELEFNPLLTRIYSMLLKSKGRSFDKYEIVWNPIYIDELSEADILEKRVNAAEKALNGTRGVGGFIDMEEARRVFNEGQIELEVEKDIQPKKPEIPEPPSPPTPSGDEDSENDIQKFNLDAATRVMIEKRKAQIERERKIGKEILKEQDKDDKNKSND